MCCLCSHCACNLLLCNLLSGVCAAALFSRERKRERSNRTGMSRMPNGWTCSSAFLSAPEGATTRSSKQAAAAVTSRLHNRPSVTFSYERFRQPHWQPHGSLQWITLKLTLGSADFPPGRMGREHLFLSKPLKLARPAPGDHPPVATSLGSLDPQGQAVRWSRRRGRRHGVGPTEWIPCSF